jgi:hypothetical protein
MIAVLSAFGIFLWFWNTVRTKSPEGDPQFEDATDPAILGLDLHRDGVMPIRNANLPLT